MGITVENLCLCTWRIRHVSFICTVHIYVYIYIYIYIYIYKSILQCHRSEAICLFHIDVTFYWMHIVGRISEINIGYSS